MQADRRKQEAAELAARQAREAAEQEAAERAAAEAEAERAATELRNALALKEASLPQEPAATEADTVAIMVRMPDGSRLSRRWAIGALTSMSCLHAYARRTSLY